MDFTEEQMTAINAMIAEKVKEATTPLTNEIAGLNRKNSELENDKRAEATAKQAAEREKLETSGTLEDFKSRAKSLEDTLAERDRELKEIRFDQAITNAVNAQNIRPDGREELVDALRFRARYADGQTTVAGQTIDAYLTDLLASERGKFYLPPPNNSGGGAMGAQTNGGSSSRLTKDNFSMDTFLAASKADRQSFLAGDHGLPEANVAVLRGMA